MGGNKIVVYKEPGVVEVEDHDLPTWPRRWG
jgi:hypothetical protein